MGSNPTPSASLFAPVPTSTAERRPRQLVNPQVEFQFCPECMAYKRMRRVTPRGEQISALAIAAIMLAWLLSRDAIHWTSWVLAGIVFPMTIYFAWPRRNRLWCEGCGHVTSVGEPL